jgi:hypothetical protein
LEVNISGVADGGVMRGTGAGTWAILAAFLDTNGRVKHEYGGIEANISAIAKGGLIAGSGTGTMALLAAGTNGEVVTYDSGEATGLKGAQAWVEQGNQLTEATTTSSIADLVSVTSLSIPVTSPALVIGLWRKTSGAAATALMGLTLNSTTVSDQTAVSTGTDQAESGIFKFWIGERVANYLRAGHLESIGSPDQGMQHRVFNTADMPNATITSVIIRGGTGSSSITMGIDQVRVYSI